MSDEILQYAPADYDAENIPPDAPEGSWNAVASAKMGKTKMKDDGTGGYPMVIVEWELETAYEAENESFVGARVTDWLVLSPEGSRGNKMSKVRIQAFCDKLGISRTLIPKHYESSADFADFIAAIDGQRTDIWTAHEIQKGTGGGEDQLRVKVLYKAPKGAANMGALPPVDPVDDADDPGEDEGGEAEAEAAAPEPEPEPTPEPKAAAKNGKAATNGKPAAAAKGGKQQSARR